MQVLKLGVDGLLVEHELPARLDGRCLVVAEPRRHRVTDALGVHPAMPPGATYVCEVHRLLQGCDLKPSLGNRVHGVIDLRLCLLELGIQPTPHFFVLLEPYLNSLLQTGSSILNRSGARGHEPVLFVADGVRSFLLLLSGTHEVRHPPFTHQLVVPAITDYWVVVRPPPLGVLYVSPSRGLALGVVENRAEAGVRCSEAHLVDANRLDLVVDVLPHLLHLRLKIGYQSPRPPDGIANLPLRL
mmetsp:Transcript_13192/g.36223  ORF Transcript_13192/g.36223 Transcript_13192/m.36223 type:complete len:243 (-) Transcript_13192:471-1199(-)